MSSENDVGVYEEFLKLHESQLRASGVPEHLFKAIGHKLNNQVSVDRFTDGNQTQPGD